MKKLLLFLVLSTAVCLSALSQAVDSTTDPGYTAMQARKPVPPVQRAARQLTVLQKKLNLKQDQVIRLRMILIHLNVSLDSLRANPSGDKKADNKARRATLQDADVQTYALLTTDQQVLYTQWKQEQQAKRKLNRAAHKGSPAADSSATSPQNH